MNQQLVQFLSGLSLFSKISTSELHALAKKFTEKKYQEGSIISVQGKSVINHVYFIHSGALELYFDKQGDKIHSGIIKAGEAFGGISILLNAGISIRTARVKHDAVLYLLPRQDFLDLCQRHEYIHNFFEDIYSQRMLDENYASIVASTQAADLLSGIVPFSFLPDQEIDQVSGRLTVIHHPKDTIVFMHGRSRVEHLYIVRKGAAERYYQEKGKKILSGLLCEGDVFGGISILLNDSIAVRTLKTTEDTYFYVLPKRYFIDICNRHPAFTEYFTNTFGKRMLDRSYAEIIAKTIQPKGEGGGVFDQPVGAIFTKNLIGCDETLSIQSAAKIMTRHRCSSIFIKNSGGTFCGVVTDNDLRRKVIAEGCAISRPVAEIMSSPLRKISAQALIFEALIEMMQHNVKHLAVTDANGRVIGVLTNRDLLAVQGKSPLFMIREISLAEKLEDIIGVQSQLPKLLKGLINGGAKAHYVTRLITTISDAVLNKIVDLAIDVHGQPPVDFVFMIMGSEGRKEQTLKTDQDNAIVFEDVPENEIATVQDYFLQLGDTVCTWLDRAGYTFCGGDVMAKNPKWCQSLSVWKQYFFSWIRTAEPEELLHSSIFFDFRRGYGNPDLIRKLRHYLFESLVGWSGFFRHLTENALHFKPPLGFFRNFIVESKGEHRHSFDLKSALMPITDFARIYSLRHNIEETNTLERLKQLHTKKVLNWRELNELEQAYSFLMQLRFARQISAVIDEGGKPDNYINPKKLSRIEQTMLKEIFKRIEKFQTKLSFDFTGLP